MIISYGRNVRFVLIVLNWEYFIATVVHFVTVLEERTRSYLFLWLIAGIAIYQALEKFNTRQIVVLDVPVDHLNTYLGD